MVQVGKFVGVMRYGSLVEFWYESPTGGVTDSVQIQVPMPDEATAERVAAAATFSLAR